MIVGVGLDMLYLPRLTNLIQRRGGGAGAGAGAGVQRLARRILTPKESVVLEEDEKLKEDVDARIRYLAVRWTAKEAAYKALSSYRSTTWKEVQVLKFPESPSGTRPLLLWTAPSDQDRAIQLHLSVSHDGDYVASTVIAERSN